MRRRHLLLLPALALGGFVTGCARRRGEPEERPLAIVFFAGDSAELDAPARAVVANAADLARRYLDLPVQVLSFASPAGSSAQNRALAAARGRAVVEALVAAGVPAGRIGVQPRGEVPFAQMPTESRRVEIHVGNIRGR
jgi:outer membrane protein OmpA-like peptidoglycan-associated protein